ncbi:MAG TPA: spermidine/putrescine ABC transporter substrate-binding protein [Burkholderiaceae bacterium]|nr:spermidine/putrescine ABC transporter substrate-binding protein [Burkholderiaceae bacterium]
MTALFPRAMFAAVFCTVLLVGCGKKEEAPPPPKAAPAEAKAEARPTGTLNLYNWNDYIAPETVERFEKEFNAKIAQTYFSDNEEMLAKLAAGATGYDIIVPTSNALEVLIKKGDLQPLDHSKLPNLKNMKPEFLDTSFDPGNKFSVPYAYSTTVIGYNDKRMKAAGLDPRGFEVLFDPKIACKVKGHITVLDSPDEVFSAAFIYLGIDPNTTNNDDYKKAADTIRKAKPCWAAFNSSSYIKEMSAGNMWLALGYSVDFFQANRDAAAAKRDFKVVSVIPSQGAVLSVDNMVIHKSAPNPALAHAFINFMMEGQNAAELSNLIGSGNANAAAMEFIKPEVKANVSVFPDAEAMKKLHQLRFLPAEQRQERGRLWTEVKVR